MSEEFLDDQSCCVQSVIPEEKAAEQQAVEQPPVTLEAPAETAAFYVLLCCRPLGGDGFGVDGFSFFIEFVSGDITPG
ncbi:MAG: hypothetical protein QXW52_09195 [Candidatus Caldarchaeum sp.]